MQKKKLKGKRGINKWEGDANNIKYPFKIYRRVFIFSFFRIFIKSVLLYNVIHPVKYYFDARYFLRRYSLNPKIIQQTRNSFAKCFIRLGNLGAFIIQYKISVY